MGVSDRRGIPRLEWVAAAAELWLPDQAHPVKIGLAAVRWVKHDQFGVSFLQVSPDARVRLAQVCQSLHEAQQQPEARVIQVSPSTTVGVLGSNESLSRGPAEDSGSP